MEDKIILKKIRGRELYIPESHMLPGYLRNPFYDSALSRICKYLNDVDNKLYVIDIGANIGDTVSLISEKTGGSFLCIEGDQDYLPILRKNVEKINNCSVTIEESFCSDTNENNKCLTIEHSRGTAQITATGNSNFNTSIKTLDSIIDQYPEFHQSNLLKIDTDGYEITVLKGASQTLQNDQPIIFFEFTPDAYLKNQQDPFELFKILSKYGYNRGLFYNNFGVPIDVVDITNIEHIKDLIKRIDNKNIYYYDILIIPEKKEAHYQSLFQSELFSCLEIFNQDYCPKVENQDLSNRLDAAINDLNNLHSSFRWKVFQALVISAKIFLPKNSFQRNIAKKMASLVKDYPEYKRYPMVKNLRNINKDSKKVVFIDHSFHTKTKSSKFIIDILKKNFSIKFIEDHSWEGQPFPDLSFIDNSYLAVFFWQSLPPKEIISQIKNDNLIFFPMYDSHGGQKYEFWKNYQKLKIICFSSTLFKKLSRWGLDTMYIQYFPKPGKFKAGNSNEVYFWQRINQLNINVLTKLFANQKVKIHIHKTTDPNHNFIKPTKQQEQEFSITYSKWSNSFKDTQNIIKNKAIYVAPREFEGIGMSFLEAMAIGKAVVAVDNPTMNEYIKNNRTGYLFRPDNPKPLNLNNLQKIQHQTYDFMVKGYKNWQKNKSSILSFIYK